MVNIEDKLKDIPVEDLLSELSPSVNDSDLNDEYGIEEYLFRKSDSLLVNKDQEVDFYIPAIPYKEKEWI